MNLSPNAHTFFNWIISSKVYYIYMSQRLQNAVYLQLRLQRTITLITQESVRIDYMISVFKLTCMLEIIYIYGLIKDKIT